MKRKYRRDPDHKPKPPEKPTTTEAKRVLAKAEAAYRAAQTIKSTPRAFTIIELIVTVAIVALLIAIALPALAGAREAARRAACLSNFRQLATAVAAYHAREDRLIWPPAIVREELPENSPWWCPRTPQWARDESTAPWGDAVYWPAPPPGPALSSGMSATGWLRHCRAIEDGNAPVWVEVPGLHDHASWLDGHAAVWH